MNVEHEIKRVAERHIDLINEYPKQAVFLCPSDHIGGMVLNLEIISYIVFYFR
jgi:hypothetical protein